jgi:hypothetical protein
MHEVMGAASAALQDSIAGIVNGSRGSVEKVVERVLAKELSREFSKQNDEIMRLNSRLHLYAGLNLSAMLLLAAMSYTNRFAAVFEIERQADDIERMKSPFPDAGEDTGPSEAEVPSTTAL